MRILGLTQASLCDALRRGFRFPPKRFLSLSRGRAFGARAFPAPFGLGARLGGRSRGPYTSDQKSHFGSPLELYQFQSVSLHENWYQYKREWLYEISFI